MAKLVQLKDKDGLIYPSVLVEKITNTNGMALKYADGTMICFGKKIFSNQVCNTDYWGLTNRSPENLSCTFPATFIEKPTVNLTFYCTVSGAVGLYKTSDSTTTTTGTFGIAIAKGSTSNRDIYIDYIAIGKWK